MAAGKGVSVCVSVEEALKNTKEILDSLINDKPIQPGSFRGRKNTAPEKSLKANEGKHA